MDNWLLMPTDLQPLHTFGLSVQAYDYKSITSVETLRALLPLPTPFLILGGGSNVLFTRHFDGLVIHNQIKGITCVREDKEWVYVRVGGGEVWHDLVRWSIEQGYGGLENLSLIPGSVGAAPIQNIGAYGVELKDVFHELEAVDLQTGALKCFNHAACAFGYRDSVFKHQYKGCYCITHVTLALQKEPQLNTSYGAIQQELDRFQATPSVQSISEAVIRIRQQKLPDPREVGNAGSFFKNPILPSATVAALQQRYPNMPVYPVSDTHQKLAAGWLIDQLGWKGYRTGDAGVHPHQALVLVNYGTTTGAELWALAQRIQASVQEHFGVVLETEVNVIGGE